MAIFLIVLEILAGRKKLIDLGEECFNNFGTLYSSRPYQISSHCGIQDGQTISGISLEPKVVRILGDGLFLKQACFVQAWTIPQNPCSSKNLLQELKLLN